ncbi:MAG: FIST N-terminal domain-containing protein [Pseudomonadota bacterium]
MVSLPFRHRPLQRLQSGRFRAAVGRGADWHEAMVECLSQLGEVGHANIGIVYIHDSLSGQVGPITAGLRTATGINDWIGTTCGGVFGGAEDGPSDTSLSILIGRFAEGQVRLFGKGSRGRTAWVRRHNPTAGLVHSTSGEGDLSSALVRLRRATGADLVGGVAGGFGQSTQIGERLSEQGLSGALFSESVPVLSSITQGCSPISQAREITEARGQFVFAIDGQPALNVLKRDIGDVLARDLRRTAGYIYAGLMRRRSSSSNGRADHDGRADFLIRDILAMDEKTGALVLSQPARNGQGILFARRDKEAALADLRRMLHQTEARLGGRQPNGAIYVSARSRGAALFDDPQTELAEIRRVFGNVPLTGFTSDGEFFDGRCYGYAGVLTLFY